MAFERARRVSPPPFRLGVHLGASIDSPRKNGEDFIDAGSPRDATEAANQSVLILFFSEYILHGFRPEPKTIEYQMFCRNEIRN